MAEEWHRVTGIELVWPGKYDAHGQRVPRERPRLPLVVVEVWPGSPPAVRYRPRQHPRTR